MPFPDTMKEATHEAMQAPKVGDRFAEMFSFYVYVVATNPQEITTLEGSPPITFPQEGKLCRYSPRSEFARRFSYGSIDGYWVSLVDQENDVDGWLDAYDKGK